MTTISIKELHERTGHWVKRVEAEQEVMVTEHGRPIARLVPMPAKRRGNPFLNRTLIPGAAEVMNREIGGQSSTEIISEGRDGR